MFIDSLKFYQKSLPELASTLSVEEKIAVKELTTISIFIFLLFGLI